MSKYYNEMMNAILLIIDSLDYTRCQSSSINLLPNITRRVEKGVKCENVYSQAPYTEAATMALYCAQNTLDNHGYIERYNNATITLMETFEKAGYDTFFNCLQPQCYPTSLRRGVKHIYYNRGYDNEALWNYRFSYYLERAQSGLLEKEDYIQIMRILDDNFNDWCQFLNDLINDDNSVKMIKSLNVEYDASGILKLVESEENKYKSDKMKYINGIFEEGKKHILFQIPYFKQKDYIISESAENVYEKECADLCKKIRTINLFQNALFNWDIYKELGKSIKSYCCKKNKKEFQERVYIIRNALIMCNNNKKYGKGCHSLKGQPSFVSHINSFLEWLDTRENAEQPYFACIHVDDIHFPEMFYTYDTDDVSVLKSELKIANEYLRKRKINSKGTISLDLSLLYADSKCEYLFSQLENKGIIDDTVIFVTADHGFSYAGYPIRNKLINSFYLENFKIPFWVFGSDIKQKQVFSLKSSVDIPRTICEMMKIAVPETFSGESMTEENEDRIITIEYCGGGCPDINNKELMIASFDKKYMVAALVSLKRGFNIKDISEIYNLCKDPLQRKNLVNKINYNLLHRYIKVIKERVNEIQRTNKEYIDKVLRDYS